MSNAVHELEALLCQNNQVLELLARDNVAGHDLLKLFEYVVEIEHHLGNGHLIRLIFDDQSIDRGENGEGLAQVVHKRVVRQDLLNI